MKTSRNAGTPWVALILWSLLATQAPAQMPADSTLRDFLPVGDLQLSVEGAVVPDAEIYRSDRAVSFLIIAPQFASPVLLSPRRGAVETVDFMKVSRRADGGVDLLADAVLASAGGFRVDGADVVFRVDDQEGRLGERPPLLGKRTAAELEEYNPEYGRSAAVYSPMADALEALGGQKAPVEVRIYFGTWCPHCSRAVPKILRIEEALSEAAIHFAYFGLAKDLKNDVEAKRLGIRGVPTGIVYRDGKEIGRIQAEGWKQPEVAIRDILRNGGTG